MERVREIADDLVSQFNCHTVILYGSRARGDWTTSSDYDILGVSDTATRIARHAYEDAGVYVDGFIYPTAILNDPDSTHLYMRDGVVVLERDGYGSELLSKLAKIFAAGPNVPEDETEMKRVWIRKMIARSKAGDIEGLYRKHWLIYSLLEDYFTLRGRWYEGPKKAFAELRTLDESTFLLFERVLEDSRDLNTTEQLATRVLDQNLEPEVLQKGT